MVRGIVIDAKEYLIKTSKELDGPIRQYIGDEEPANLIAASRQYPYAGGKRMRPAMVLAAAGAVGGDVSKAVPLAVAVEYIHNFTLIHDDFMDGDEKRRGMTTIHIAYDVPTAILAGDALFAKAFQLIAELDVPDRNMKEVLRYVSQAVWDLARGQQMDINNEGKIVSEEAYIETIRLKTSVLFAAAAAGGALVGGAGEKIVTALHEYAMALGLGFQIFDDYLGIAGDPSKTGKSVGNDIRKGKCTVMVTHAMRNIKDPKVLEEFKGILGNMKATEEQTARARSIMESAGSITYGRQLAQKKVDEAISKLDVLAPSEYKEFMIALARYAIDREV
ncbi:MAG: polyprenyl synthetase family protein [Candidatus Methanoplasma sp.]|jgi:geranylgeranyl diphosphate synthase type I|nr:polyprenyl synthetase family protein [Candidatus Methanoplasma sp.]